MVVYKTLVLRYFPSYFWDPIGGDDKTDNKPLVKPAVLCRVPDHNVAAIYIFDVMLCIFIPDRFLYPTKKLIYIRQFGAFKVEQTQEEFWVPPVIRIYSSYCEFTKKPGSICTHKWFMCLRIFLFRTKCAF